MQNKEYLIAYIEKLKEKISQAEEQWKGTRFAAVDDSTLSIEGEEDKQYEQILQKYRGKNGDLKPLGLILFNRYLSGLFVLFLALTLLFVPVAMTYSFGGGLSEFRMTSSLSRSLLTFSIASLPRYRLDDLSDDDLSEIKFHRYLTLSTDIIAIIVIFVYVLYMKVVVTKITREYMAKSPAPNLYCLEVSNIEGNSQEQIAEHFSKFGKIAQVSGIYTHRDVIFELRNIVKQITHLSHISPDGAEYEEIVEQVSKKYRELAEAYLSIPQIQIKSMFICYDQISTRNRVYDLYKYEINPQKLVLPASSPLLQLSKCSEHRTSIFLQQNQASSQRGQAKKQFMGKKPIVKKCRFEPLTLNWQNCDIGRHSQNKKFFCQFILLLIVLFVILLGLFLININSSHIRQSQKPSSSASSSSSSSPSTFSTSTSSFTTISSSPSSTTQLQQNLNQDQSKQRYTFCASLTIIQFKWEHYNLCADYLQFQGNRFVLMILFALLVAVINLLTNRILWALVAFRRYRTLSQRNTFLITSIFLFSLVNSAILILLVRGHYTGPILRQIVGKILNFSEDVMYVTVYSEFNRNWYMNIGAQLMINYMVSLIIFPHFHIILHWIRSKYRQIKSKHSQKKQKKPVFNYCTFYAMSLKSIFFALIYSNAMPIFYLLCCIALAVEIGLGKILLKKFVDEPVFVDNNAINVLMSVSKVATNLIPYALLAHCFTSILFLNVEEIFPTTNSYQNTHNSWTEVNLLKLEKGFVYILIFLFISIYIFNSIRIDQLLINYWLGRTQSKAECDLTKRFKEIKNNPAFLSSYKMKDNPKYKILFDALQLFSAHMEKLRFKKQSLPIKSLSELFQDETTFEVIDNTKQTNTLKALAISQSPSEQITHNEDFRKLSVDGLSDMEEKTQYKMNEKIVQSLVYVDEDVDEEQKSKGSGDEHLFTY